MLLINKANKSRIALRSGSVYSGDRMWTLISGSICQANVGRRMSAELDDVEEK